MFEKTDLKYFFEGEFRVGWIDRLPDQLLNFCPMPVFHTVSPEGDHERELRLEIFHVVLDSLTDRCNMRHGLILEVLVGVDDVPETFFNKFFSSVGVNGLELVVHPDRNVSVPSVYNGPEGVVRSEVFNDLLESRVVGLFPVEENLTGVEFSGLFK
jgi:hypothetical protein